MKKMKLELNEKQKFSLEQMKDELDSVLDVKSMLAIQGGCSNCNGLCQVSCAHYTHIQAM